ncbi:Aspartokinase [Geodia barretti]|uniref:Aspartokinase n=1 Tax=Geodia barretti TaxID=519541 RepID=A0AA35VYW9_GEOBA|nr:Aspartokinase [Geodia barretti]
MPQTKQVVVQKYGGSSLATEELLRNVAKRVVARRLQGADLVVCVSAMGDTTDELLKLAHRLSGDYSPSPRETDALISTGELVSASLMGIAIRGLGHDAISLSGRQAGIQTDETFGSARIANIEPTRVLQELERGRIVVIAGFQGLTPADDTTTLGRGASDLTAVAIAASVKADICEIYTDVDGILTADPRLVPDAKVIPHIGYEEMLEMASLGAKMNPRSIEMAAVHNVPMLITSSFNTNATGTKIGNFEDQNSNMEIRKSITSIATERSVARVTLHGIADRPGIAAAIMMPLRRRWHQHRRYRPKRFVTWSH